MCGFLKTPKAPELPASPTADQAAETARTDSLERRRKVAASGKSSTILAGSDEAQNKLKSALGA